MSLEDVMKKINKELKQEICNKGVVYDDIPRIPFSSPRMNYMTYGGMPIGRIVEFSGQESGGKTTTALDICASAQKMFPDKKVVIIDIERTFDPIWAAKLGVNVEDLFLITPNEQTAEQIFEITKEIIESGEVSVCVLDSLGVMVSKQAYSKTIEDKTYGGISQALTLFSKEMIPICARTGCLLIGINQVRDDMNSQYGGTVTTGGRAWRHNCTVRMEFAQSDFFDESGVSVTRSTENPAGHAVRARVVKSKIFPCNRKIGFYSLRYLEGIDYIFDTIDVAIKEGAIIAAGAWYSIVNPDTGEVLNKFQGKAKLKEFLKENPESFNLINEYLLSKNS